MEALESPLRSASAREQPAAHSSKSRATNWWGVGNARLWMTIDGFTIFGAAIVAALVGLHSGPVAEAKGLWHGTLIQGRSMTMLLALLIGFAIFLVFTSRRLNLYRPKRLSGILQEQKASVQACLASGLMLAGSLYLIHAEDIPRRIVLSTVGLVTIFLSLRRLTYRLILHIRHKRGTSLRRVLIVGSGPEAHALREHLESCPNLGYICAGCIIIREGVSSFTDAAGYPTSTVNEVSDHALRKYVDEIFVTASCERATIRKLLEQTRIHAIDLTLIPDLEEGVAGPHTIEYIGQFPTIPLRRDRLSAEMRFLKRAVGVAIACPALLVLSPLCLAIAVAIKLDSRGPVFYSSERIGRKGRVFKCLKFRTMVPDAEMRLEDVMHLNERDEVLFKVRNDPRITRLGHFLRKYSLDELPQFLNVIRGDMSIVGPRPPLPREVHGYQLKHLRRLDVKPGITGLWQVNSRHDPSFENYVSLDIAYIEHWSLWLDFTIIVRTIAVVFAGTGS